MLGEILAGTETSVTATLSQANINRGGTVLHKAAMDKVATNATGPDVGKTATASLPPIGFETIGAATGTKMTLPSIAVGRVTAGAVAMTTGTIGAIGIIGMVVVHGIGGAGPQRHC